MTPRLDSPDGRRAWAFLALLGGCVVFTLFAAAGVFLVRRDAGFSFWLALAAHAQILVAMTALSALLVRRTVRAGRDGVEISDHARNEEAER